MISARVLEITRNAAAPATITPMPSFADDLRRFGPGSEIRCSPADARAYCADPGGEPLREFQRRHLADAASPVPAFQSIYAFCRWSDDLGDEVGDRTRSLELLAGGGAS